MKSKQLLSIAILMLGCVVIINASPEAEAECVQRGCLSPRAVMTSPVVHAMVGEYFLIKDIIHSRLGAYVPHVLVYDTELSETTWFPSPTRDADLFSSNKKRYVKRYVKGVKCSIRYRNLGSGLLLLAFGEGLYNAKKQIDRNRC